MAETKILDTIAGITRDARLLLEDAPCLKLPAEAFNAPHLVSECPHCHNPLRFNPFVVDNRGGGTKTVASYLVPWICLLKSFVSRVIMERGA